MRNRFDQQLGLGTVAIEDVQISTKSRDAMPALLKALQSLYKDQTLNSKICGIMEKKLCKGKKATGRKGMSLWELFVMAQTRLCLNIGYDRLHYLANHDGLMRQIMGVEPTDFSSGKEYEYQNIYDNVGLLDDETVKQINAVIVEFGHGVFKKKEAEALRVKTDSFVVESNVHFPTDINLTWDSARKCLDCIEHLLKEHPSTRGWRKIKNWYGELKNQTRNLSKIGALGGKNKEERQQQIAKEYVTKCTALSKRLHQAKQHLPLETMTDLAIHLELEYYLEMLDKHIDLVNRRLLKGEKIPHEEKLFSIFETYTEWITKGKLRPNVELGKKLLVSTDQYHLIVDYQIMEHQTDNQLAIVVADRLLQRYKLWSLSFDKGFWSQENKELLSLFIPHVVLPKKGKPNQTEQQTQAEPKFKRLRKAHSAVESNINELEHRGLDRCPDRGRAHFDRYIGLGVCAYNLHKIGKELLRQEKAAQKKKVPEGQLKMAA